MPENGKRVKKAPVIKNSKIATPTSLVEADSILTQPQYQGIKFDIDNLPKDVVGAINYVVPVIKSGQEKLNARLVEYQKDNPDVKELPYEEAVKAFGDKKTYDDLLEHVNVYNKYRSQTALSPRIPPSETGLIDVDSGDSNTGAVLKYGKKTPYGADLQGLFAPYEGVQKKSKGGTVKAPKLKKKGYAKGGPVQPLTLSESDKATYDSLTNDGDRNAFLASLTEENSGGFDAQNAANKVGSSLPWLAAANAGKDLFKSNIERDEYNNPSNSSGKVADELLTPDHEQMINDIKNKDYGQAILDSTGMGKFGRALSKGLGKEDETSGFWGKANDITGISDENQRTQSKIQKNTNLKRQADMLMQGTSDPITRLKDGGEVTPKKAKEILKDGTAHGKPLTDDQKAYFGWIIGGKKQEKKEGGEVKGKGTAKSDSIDAKLEPGTFVVPEENAEKAEELREQFLGSDTKKANINKKKGTPVKLSNGEHLFSPDEKSYLEKMGVDLTKLAPNANSYANGTDERGVPRVDGEYSFPGATDTSASDKLLVSNTKSPIEDKVLTETHEKDNRDQSSRDFDWLSLLGPAQAVLGVRSLTKDGKRPVDALSSDYIESVTRAQQDASYGLDPASRQRYLGGIETARLGNVNLAGQTAGGNAALANAQARAATNTYANQLLGLESEDARVKEQKKRYADALVSDKQEKQRRLFEDKLNAFNVNQEAGAGLLNAGIENIIGSSRYKNEKNFYNDLLLSENTANAKLGESLINK